MDWFIYHYGLRRERGKTVFPQHFQTRVFGDIILCSEN